ncbi:sulfite exporter TauE/SafE family protein [Staphylococcus edaphicus]|uniref:Probable membrane transporter protein n=2 Tax=Staphylococcus edaphicus TaxID=1955013 RepID=A0A2C6VIH2_9STAP|nr:sulfite exporter TauE/SafE family protein [Staphylococcus edaphicus]PHK50031.1 permease [Staphylococcus edaphicus]UQW81709.1 sulfite exporter TauE/SafE family protein [Staphylococcus edaphicus]
MDIFYVLILFAIFLGGLVRTYFGFGEALVSMPLLTLIGLDIHTSISVIGLAGILVASFNIFLDYKSIDYKMLVVLLVGSLVGVPLGIWILHFVNTSLVQLLLGIFLILYGIYAFGIKVFIKNHDVIILKSSIWTGLTGIISGILGSLYNSHGVPVVIYGTMTGLPIKTLSSTIQAHFLLTAILVVIGQGTGNIWTNETLPLFFLACPLLLISVVIGKYCKQRTMNRNFDLWLYLFIVMLGIILISSH